jgi:diguanylate cyclase (GGDEF)-like protein/PAS domain S-box-containing protein
MKQIIHNAGERRFRELLDSASHPTWITDSTGHCTFLNKAWTKVTGQPAKEGEGYGWIAMLHPEDRKRAEDGFIASSDLEAFYCVQYRLRMVSGGYRWHMDIAIPRFDDDGEFMGYVGNVIDIHERKLAEKEIELSNNRFGAAIQAISGVMWFTDANGNVIEEQPSWSQFTGQTFDEYKGKGWSNAVHPDDREHCHQMWAAALEHKRPLQLEDRLRRADGEWRVVSVRAIPVFDEEGNVREWVGVSTDITERKEEERRVEHMATHDALTALPNRMLFEDRLNHLIRHRTSKMHAVLFLDLDAFKAINDTQGHHVGDQLLQEIARRLAGVVRDGDTVARFGGDEFLVLVENLDAPEGAVIPAEHILAAVSEPVHLAQQTFTVHASIGISVYPRDGQEASPLMRHADVAMYEAKKFKGGAFRFYEHNLEFAIG